MAGLNSLPGVTGLNEIEIYVSVLTNETCGNPFKRLREISSLLENPPGVKSIVQCCI